MRRLCKDGAYVLLLSPLCYAAGLLFVAIPALSFFLGQQFFVSGTSDLRTYFAAFPYTSILTVPAVCSCLPHRAKELSLPAHSLAVAASQFVCAFCALCVFLLLTVCVPVAVSVFGSPDPAQLSCAYCMMLLYEAACVSACLFLRTLLGGGAASFIAGAVLLAVTNSAHLVPLYVAVPRAVNAVVRAVSFAWHFDAASKGILDSRDVIFFAAVTAGCIAASAFLLEVRRGCAGAFLRRVALLAAVAFVLILADSSLLFVRVDTTHDKRFSVSGYSKGVIAQVSEPLVISHYLSRTLKDLYPQVDDVSQFLDAYASESTLVSYQQVDPAKDSAEELLNRYGIYGQQIDTSGRESTSYATVYSAVVIQYLGSTEVIPFVLDTSTLEFDLTGRVQSLVSGTVRAVQVVVGNGLGINAEYAYVIPWLQSQGFTTAVTVLPSQESAGAVPFTQLPGVPLLVLGSVQFAKSDARALADFVATGGKAFVLTTPHSVDIRPDGDWSAQVEQDAVDAMLMDFGLFFYQSLTADVSCFGLTLTSTELADGTPAMEQTQYVNYPLWPSLMPQTNARDGMTLFWPCAMTLDADSALTVYHSALTPVLVTSSRAWQIKPQSGRYETNPFVVPKTSEDVTLYDTFTLAARADHPSGGVLYVLGDQYALTANMLGYGSGQTADLRAFDFVTDTLLVLNGQQDILSLKNRSLRDQSLYKKDAQERFALRNTTIVLTIAVPLALLIAIFVLFALRRKRLVRSLRGNHDSHS